MASPAIADLLTDFAPARGRVAASLPQAPARASAPEPAPEKPNVEAIVAEAVARAERETAERLELTHREALQAEREAHARELEALNVRQGEELAARITAAMQEAERQLISVSSEAAARVLSHFLSEQIVGRAVAELARTIRIAVADADGLRIRVRGPQSLFLPLEAAMGDLSKYLEFTESPGADLTVTVNETLFETRLADWSTALSEVMP